jgi:beta-1,4-N-acetylglucosaminyltransferase
MVPEPCTSSLLLERHEQGGHAIRVKICFLASGGGHFQQLCGLACLAEEYDHFLISTIGNRAATAVRAFQPIYLVGEPGQGSWKRHPSTPIRVLWEILRIFARERPNLVISTGSGIAVPGFIAAKILRIRTIYIEAYARVHSLSLAGRICRHLSDRFLVQHRGLADQLPRAVYAGTLYSHLGGGEHGFCDDR